MRAVHLVQSFIAMAMSLLLGAAGLVVAAPAAQALSGSDFEPGFIISDDKFYDADALSASEVQTFLEQRMKSCVLGYTCLKDYTQATPTMAANSYCAEYRGSSREPASAIIAKVGAACGVSQQVLLVLLQKETSLVTRTNPTQWYYDRATGFACPDTAPCDLSYGGFFYQVYYAARQFQVYRANPTRYNYQAGRTNTIPWHPNSSCGTSNVYIHNQATAGLYIYTPYRPNAAALANYPGTGDSCSSYGNRNFWFLYSNWFGSSGALGQLEIEKTYDASGGAAGELGAPVADYVVVSANGGGVYRRYAAGLIAWSPGYGTRVVPGDNLSAYAGRGGPAGSLGFPRGEDKYASAAGGGYYQWFENGIIYRTASHGAIPVEGTVLDTHQANGGVGALGWPARAASFTAASGGGILQRFEEATIAARGDAGIVVPAVLAEGWSAAGGPEGSLRWPTAAASSSDAYGGGRFQWFDGGLLMSSPAGTHPVQGSVLSAYRAQDYMTGMGWPAGPVTRTSNAGGGSWQRFTGGAITVHDGSAFSITDGIEDGYFRSQGPAGQLGWPRSSTRVAYASGGGFWQNFDGGRVLSSPFGSYALTGGFLAAHNELGGVAGKLGWPTWNRAYNSTYKVYIQAYQYATVFHTGKAYTYVAPELASEALDRGFFTGSLGWTRGEPQRTTRNGGGVWQEFDGGILTWNEDTGTHLVTGGFATALMDFGGPEGAIGWSRGDRGRDSITGLYRQDFSKAAIFHTGRKATWIPTQLLAKVDELGGLTGTALGWTTDAPRWDGDTLIQTFDGGTMTWNESSGVVWTPSA